MHISHRIFRFHGCFFFHYILFDDFFFKHLFKVIQDKKPISLFILIKQREEEM